MKKTRARSHVLLASRIRRSKGLLGQRVSSCTTILYIVLLCATKQDAQNVYSAKIGSLRSPSTMSTRRQFMRMSNRAISARNLTVWDHSGNFFLSEDDIGKNRDAACVEKPQELNNAVLISALTEEITTEHLSEFQAVIFTNLSLDKVVEFNDYFRSHQPPIPFIKTEVCGLFGGVFCDLRPLDSRYDAQISVFGSKLQKKMRDSYIFVVASGALGCEFLKNFALVGVCCGRKGKLTITDDYVLEKSLNFSKQFLFRDWNIGQAKSTVSITAASAINSSLHIDALQNCACPETEHVFNDAFWEGLGAVINAQVRELLQCVCEWLDKDRCDKFEDCIAWARLKFEDYFSNRVKQLTFTFPEDAPTSTGAPFWSAPKRFPCPVKVSAVDSSHIQFILAASMLRAVSFCILIPDWLKNMGNLADIVSKVAVPEFEPKSGVKIETEEKATNLSSASVDDVAVIEDLLTKLEACAKKLPSGFQMQPIQFEKDDDTNFHMNLIAGLANMRARNNGIQEVDKLKAKFIAGRIIPAIATTTGGLVCLELYKVLAGDHIVEDYCNTFASVALPMFSIAEPVPPKVVKHQEMRWTVWDRWSIKGNITVARTN